MRYGSVSRYTQSTITGGWPVPAIHTTILTTHVTTGRIIAGRLGNAGNVARAARSLAEIWANWDTVANAILTCQKTVKSRLVHSGGDIVRRQGVPGKGKNCQEVHACN